MNVLPAVWTKCRSVSRVTAAGCGRGHTSGGGAAGQEFGEGATRPRMPHLQHTLSTGHPVGDPPQPSAPHCDPSLPPLGPKLGHHGLSRLLPLGPSLPGSRGLSCARRREGWWLLRAAFQVSVSHPVWVSETQAGPRRVLTASWPPPGDPSGPASRLTHLTRPLPQLGRGRGLLRVRRSLMGALRLRAGRTEGKPPTVEPSGTWQCICMSLLGPQ